VLTHVDRLAYAVRADAILSSLDWSWCDACEFKYLEEPRAAVSVIHEIAWSANFFRHFWIWIPSERKIVSALEELLNAAPDSTTNVGVVVLRELSDGFDIVRRPGTRSDTGWGEARNRFISAFRANALA
jgi:hypothetical protein